MCDKLYMSIRVISAIVLSSLFIQHVEGLQRVVVISELRAVQDNFSVNDEGITDESEWHAGDNSNSCCVYGNCTCTSLYNALVNLTSNVLVNITTDVKSFGSIISLDSLANITLIGHNNPTIHCNSNGRIYFSSCHNCTIEGIIWERCGARNINDTKIILPALQFYNSSGLNVKNCSFQNSTGQVLVLSAVSGDVNINHCNFSYNQQYKGHGTAVHYSSGNLHLYHYSAPNITINGCKFYRNNALSVVYFAGPPNTTDSENPIIHLQSSTFYSNKGVPIYLSNQKLLIYGYMDFYSNVAENGGGIFISDYSKVMFCKNARINFRYNKAWKNGGALYLTNHSTIMFKEHPVLHHKSYDVSGEETFKEIFLFFRNRAIRLGRNIYAYQSYITFGNNVTVSFNGGEDYGQSSAVYIDQCSNITFEANSKVSFVNYQYSQHGGALCISGQSDVTFKGNTTVKFYNNVGLSKSGVMYVNYSTVIFKENCKVIFDYNQDEGGALYILNSLVSFEENSKVMFSNNTAHYGGALYIGNCSLIKFEGKSTAVFDNNIADIGGAVYIEDYCTVTFKANSNIKFYNNKAQDDIGGALYLGYHSIMMFKENSTAIFDSNEAVYDGGAVYIKDYSKMTFEDNSTTTFYGNAVPFDGGAMCIINGSIVIFEGTSTGTFYDNLANYYGGAMYIADGSTFMARGNTLITFNNNKASLNGGAMYAADWNSKVTFAENSILTFKNNTANNNGGAVYITDYCMMRFEGNSIVIFDSNIAYNHGGVIFTKTYGAITFEGNSKVNFSNNSANSGGAIYTFLSCIDIMQVMRFAGNSTISFHNNTGDDKGGAVTVVNTDPTYAESCYPLKFDNFSKVTFINNKAINGGAVYVDYNINMRSQDYSVLIFRSNLAHTGGAIYAQASNITFKGNSDAIFNNNVALQNGGALFSYRQCKILFTENSSATFGHNEATQGGVMYIQFNSLLTFGGNCETLFTANKAIEYGGVIHSSVDSLVVFDNHANVHFCSNTARIGGAINLFMSSITSRSQSIITFQNNSAETGGAIYVSESNITFSGNSIVDFIENTALQNGGAVYLSERSNFMLINMKITFFENFASDDGKSVYVQMKKSLLVFNNTNVYFNNTEKLVYINVPKSCNRSCLFHHVQKTPKNISLPIVTSPRKLTLYDPAKCVDRNNSGCHTYYINNIMLGQEIRFNACVLDFYDQPTEITQFLVNSMDHPHFNVSGSEYISVLCNYTTQGISVIGNLNTSSFNYSIDISLYSTKTSGTKMVSVKLIVELSQCHLGFQYVSKARKCECYNTRNIISCSGSSSTIKRGYWFGSVNDKSTVTACPNDYCDFTCCEITNGIYHLHPARANQCKSHRSGVACGDCENGYTLSFDSPKCIEVNVCTIGQTILVTTLSLVYWIAVIVVVFVMMHCKVAIGSLYAIIYYYSLLDIFLRQASSFSNGLYTAVSILSSLAKLTPQFLGQLCLVRNMSGIDQQFIHYTHPVVVLIILVMISMLARRSHKISLLISRGIIHFICFLLLLSYTSVTTTSLLLMRSLTFTGIDKIYTYLSPDIEYFHGRHLVYVIVAAIFTIIVVISLPLLLLLEPFLNSKINFFKIKPLLDQFQGCYKDKYRYFAAYYLICRIVIISLVMMRSSDDLITQYTLIGVCAVIALVHFIVRPYADKTHNIFDGTILQLMVIVSVLPILEFVENYNKILVTVIAYTCTILPIVSFISLKFWINKSRIQDTLKSFSIKYLHKYNTVPSEDVEIPPINESRASARSSTTTVDINHNEERLPDIMWCREPFLEILPEIEAWNDITN